MVSVRAPATFVWPLPLQVKEVTPVGSGSLTVTLVAVLGPLLDTTMVYVVIVPGTAVVAPSVLLTVTSYCGVRAVSVSLALLLLASESVTFAGGVTVAVLLNKPVAEATMVPVTR